MGPYIAIGLGFSALGIVFLTAPTIVSRIFLSFDPRHFTEAQGKRMTRIGGTVFLTVGLVTLGFAVVNAMSQVLST